MGYIAMNVFEEEFDLAKEICFFFFSRITLVWKPTLLDLFVITVPPEFHSIKSGNAIRCEVAIFIELRVMYTQAWKLVIV